MTRTPLLVLLPALLMGCGEQEVTPPLQGSEGYALVTIRVEPTPDAPPLEAELACPAQRGEGYLDGKGVEACRDLLENEEILVSGPDPERVCTQEYGGPEEALFVGEIDGRVFSTRFGRTNGCEIADWNRLGALVPGAG